MQGHKARKGKIDMPKFVTPSEKSNHEEVWDENTDLPLYDQAFVMNNAAKDDLICTLSTFTIQDLLANDPGSAAFVDFHNLPEGAFSEVDGIYTVDWSLVPQGFDYVIRMANGTYSTAHVGGIAPTVGGSLFFDSFENYTPVTVDPSWGYTANLSEYGWSSSGAPTEIVGSGYQGIGSTDPLDLTHWLDTQATPNGIDISHEVVDTDGGYVQISLSVSNEVFSGYMIPHSVLEISWNGVVVGTIDNDDFAADNTFQPFTYEAASSIGSNTLRIHDTVDGTNVGFAIDFVGVSSLVCEPSVA